MGEQVCVIDAPHFYAGIVTNGSFIIDAAPIVRYMIGKNEDWVRSYCNKKNWKITRLKKK